MDEQAVQARRISIAAILSILMLVPQAAWAAPKDKTTVHDFTNGAVIDKAFSQFDRLDDHVTMKIRTAVEPGHAFTIWAVIFNDPSACSDGACGEDDIFLPNHDLNVPQIQAARVSILWTTGGVSNPAGRLAVDGAIPEGGDAPGQVLLGLEEDGALVPVGVTTGIEDTAAAEIHFVVQDHGVAHDDPELLEQQTTMVEAACNPECADVQFSVHLP